MLIPSSKKTNSFLPIPTSKTGGTLVAKFQPAKKEAPVLPISTNKTKQLLSNCKTQKICTFLANFNKQTNRHGTEVCLELTVRRVSLAASVASETLTPAAVAVSFAASAACPVWYWIFSPTSPASHPTNQKKEKETPQVLKCTIFSSCRA
jgi:hypothetical protein